MTHANRIIGDCPSGWGEVGLEAKQLLHEDVNTSINLLDTTVGSFTKAMRPCPASLLQKRHQISRAVCWKIVWYEIKVQKLLILPSETFSVSCMSTCFIHVSVYDKPFCGAVLFTSKPLFPPNGALHLAPQRIVTASRTQFQESHGAKPSFTLLAFILTNQPIQEKTIGHGRFEDLSCCFEFDVCFSICVPLCTERPLNFVHGHQGDKSNL